MQSHNPYAAPTAAVHDAPETLGDGEYVAGGRAVPSGHGWEWIVRSFNLFRQSWGLWILFVIVFLGASFVLSGAMQFIPLLGVLVQVAYSIVYPILGGGILIACDAQAHGEALEARHFLAGFREHAKPLALVGLLSLGCMLVVAVIAGIVTGVVFGVLGKGMHSNETIILALVMFFLLLMALAVPVAMAIWFAPSLVVFQNMGPWQAMKESFRGCAKNVVPFLLYGIILTILGVVAMIPLGLGLLVLLPIIMISVYWSYRDIYLREA